MAKKRKRRTRAQSSSNGLVWGLVGGGLAVVLLVGGIVAVRHLKGRGSASGIADAPNGKSSTGSGESSAPTGTNPVIKDVFNDVNWIEFAPPNGHFRLKFPEGATPKVLHPNSKQPRYSWEFKSGEYAFYCKFWDTSNMSDPLAARVRSYKLDVTGMDTTIAGPIGFEQPFQHQGYPAMDCGVDMGQEVFIIRTIATENRLIQAGVRFPKGDAPELVRRHIDSIVIDETTASPTE